MTEMKKFLTIAFVFAALTACQKGDDAAAVGDGGMRLDLSASSRVASVTGSDAQGGFYIETPGLSEFVLTITGGDYYKTWENPAEYTSEERFPAGVYEVTLQYGESDAEGFDKPCFMASGSVEVFDRNRISDLSLTASLQNSIVEVVMTDNFKGYFVEHDFTLTTASGTEYKFADALEGMLFVPAGSSVSVACSALRQSAVASGERDELAVRTLTMRACTRHILKYDLERAGSVKVNITFDDEIVATITLPVELNENA